MGAASAFGSGYVAWLVACLLLPPSVALPNLVGVRRQLVHRVVEGLLGVGRLLVGHALVVAGRGHVGLLRVEVALEERLVGLTAHVHRNLSRALPLDGANGLVAGLALDLEPHCFLLPSFRRK